MKIITIDFETYWDSKDYTLSKMGPIEYIRDPRFHAQMVGVRVDRGPVQIFSSDEGIRRVLQGLELHKPDRMVVAHNGNGFDFLILSERYGIRPAWMFDPMVAMRWTGLSRVSSESHAALTNILGTGVKTAGTVISNGKHWSRDFSPYEQQAFEQYCKDDVLQCSENTYALLPYCTPDVVRFCTITARMATEPKLFLDTTKLEQYRQELDDATERARLEMMALFHFSDADTFLKAIRSAPKMCEMLRSLGVEPPVKYSAAKTATAKAKLEAELHDLQAAGSVAGGNSIDARIQELMLILSDEENYAVYTPALSKQDLDFTALLEHEDPRVALLVQSRLDNNSSIQRSRADKFHGLSLGGKPLPVMLNALKAHTSRYTAGSSEGSDGTNLQNLNKRNKKQLTLRQAIRPEQGDALVAVDSSQIEARLLAWLAGQVDLLQSFARKGDPYSELAEKVFGIAWQDIKAGAKAGDPKMTTFRNVGKTGILSAGYGVGAKKFSDTLLRSGAKLHPDLDKHFEMAKHAHNVYRQSNYAIVAFWKRCQKVIEHLEQGGSGKFGGPTDDVFWYGMMPLPGFGNKLFPTIQMPTGFKLVYPGLRAEMNERGKLEYLYDKYRGRNAVPTRIYGGSLTENLTQGLAFQMLMWQACRMDENLVPLVANNHDAWIAVCRGTMAENVKSKMMHWMSTIPDWLLGLPVDCEGGIGHDFTIA